VNPTTFAQPEPGFDPLLPQPAPPASPRSRRRLIPVVTIAVVALVAFGGGFAVANATITQASANGGNQGFGPNASGRPRGGFGGNTSGTVGSVAAGQMTVTTQNGSKIVLLTPTTKVTQVTAAKEATSAIASGATVTVVGTANPDGSVTATSVIIGDLSALGRGAFGGGQGGQGGQGASPASSTTP
jgi:hypothetical protein